MGKYDGIVEKLPKEPSSFDDPNFAQKVAMARKEIQEANPEAKASFIALKYRETRAKLDSAKEITSALNVVVEALEQMIKESFEVEGLTMIKLEDGSSVGTQVEPAVSVKDPETFRRWCIKRGLEEKMKLPPASATALIKEMLLAGETEPPGVEVYARTTVKLRGA